jgi:hypothetical protein
MCNVQRKDRAPTEKHRGGVGGGAGAGAAGIELQRNRCAGAYLGVEVQVCRGTVVQRFRETEVKWCRFAKLQRC